MQGLLGLWVWKYGVYWVWGGIRGGGARGVVSLGASILLAGLGDMLGVVLCDSFWVLVGSLIVTV